MPLPVFWKRETWAPAQPGEVEKADEEEVEFPGELFEELRRGLEESQALIPASARKFQGWEVGLLERFDIGDVKRKEAIGEEKDIDGSVGNGAELSSA
ncbi:hypothetical protein SLS60_005130 [Paraconiothyrium brasiliense]|uniref:Uncharacterized protein n=1 Tax=Paraconiothyrium brasiliense TaxID=300254 RepID=A0ABR3RGP8_9PLEO